MADVFTQAAAILKLITSAITTGKRVYEVTNELKSAPQHIRALATDVDGFHSTLVQLQTLFTDENSEAIVEFIRREDSKNLQDVVENCLTTFSEIDHLVEDYKFRTKEMNFSTWRRVMWTFKQAQVVKLRETLLSHKMNLAIAIAVVNAYVQPCATSIPLFTKMQLFIALHTGICSSNRGHCNGPHHTGRRDLYHVTRHFIAIRGLPA